jgi:hypothetical protein
MSMRSDGQRTGDKGESLVVHLAEDAGGWIARPQLKDYGVDLELELDKPFVAGQFLKVQVRAHERTEDEANFVTAKVEKSQLVYAQECRVPVILVVADTSAKTAYYCWLQHWLESGTGRRVLGNDHASHYLQVARTFEFVAGLGGELRQIAKNRTPFQLWLGVRDVLRCAIGLKDQRVVDALAALMRDSAAVGRLPIDDVLRELADLGERIFGTEEGARAQMMLFRLCTSLGAEFTADQIEKMVIREERFSRTGIRALGVPSVCSMTTTSAQSKSSIYRMSSARLRIRAWCTTASFGTITPGKPGSN